MAIGVNEDSCREVIGCAESFAESKERWRGFPSRLRSQGLRGVRMFIGDKAAAGMVGSVAEVFPGEKHRRCPVHSCRNALAKVPKSKRPQVAAMLKAMKLKEAAKVVREGFAETLTYCDMPREHWRRTRIVGTFLDGKSALMLAPAATWTRRFTKEQPRRRLAENLRKTVDGTRGRFKRRRALDVAQGVLPRQRPGGGLLRHPKGGVLQRARLVAGGVRRVQETARRLYRMVRERQPQGVRPRAAGRCTAP